MATKPPSKVAFISKLLAPLPTDVEQVEDRRYILELRADRKRMWFGQGDLAILYRAEHAYRAVPYGTAESERLWAEYVRLLDRQMLKPAHGRGEVRWKQSKLTVDGGRPEWEAAIARDEAWVARLDAAGIFVKKKAA